MKRPSRFDPPAELEEFRLGRLLGEGASGQVFLAEDTLLGRSVAIKLLAAGPEDAGKRDRFFAEARALARLQHPNVVTVHRVGEVRGRPFLVTELVRGRPLDRTPRPLPWREALALGVGLARGLAAAHRRGILHGDVKPANVMRTPDGDVKLLDFGLARLRDDRASDHVGSDEQRAADDGTPPVSGTPLYLAPERWDQAVPSIAADLYAVGAVLFELCSGRPPHLAPDVTSLVVSVRAGTRPALRQLAPEVDHAFAAVIERCLEREPTDRFASAADLLDALLALAAPPIRLGDAPPYRGLAPLDGEHRALFFGRERETRAVIDRLRAAPFVLVTGESGVGKSSLCRAGVLPEVAAGALGPGRWVTVKLGLGRQLTSLLAEVVGTLASGNLPAALEQDDIDPSSDLRRLRRWMHQTGVAGVVVFVDHLEQLHALDDSAAENAAAALAALAAGVPGIKLLASARIDFVGRLAGLPYLGEHVADALWLLPPLGRAGVRDLIVAPARAAGFAFESATLVEALLDQAGTGPGALPLLQFALAELWELRDHQRRFIPAAALATLGGVNGAIARRGDALIAALTPADHALARKVLVGLVGPGGVRRRRTAAELAAGHEMGVVRRVLEALIEGRLVIAREPIDPGHAEGSYELAHEALVVAWPRLRQWLDEDGARQAQLERLDHAAAEWRRSGRAAQALLSADQLAQLAVLDRAHLRADHARFVQASRRALRWTRWRRWSLPLAIPATALLAFGGARLRAALQRAEVIESHLGRAADDMARAERAAADSANLRQTAFERFSTGDFDGGEAEWSRAVVAGRDADAWYERGISELEAALVQDPGPPERLSQRAGLLYKRALLAEALRQPERRDDLVRRLRTTAGAQAWVRAWEAPGSLAVVTSPSGALVELAPAVSDEGREPPVRARSPARFELLRPGSWRLRIELAGHAPTTLPILLARGERYTAEVALLPTAKVPPGFVHVPAGRFLFGAPADDFFRRHFLRTPPAYAVTTAAYLIAVNETTYGDWIRYLEAQPALAVVRPGVSGPLAVPDVTLQRRGAGWELTLRPTPTTHHVLRDGEPLVYPGRRERRRHDWRRLPVGGVSFDDALAYARWLDHSGVVPGARLCTELEWERAARGADGRSLPHGESYRPDDANWDATYGKRPDAMGPDEVGSHPRSRSVFGVDDLAGNAFEWVVDVSARRERDPIGGQERGLAMVRGGCYYQDPLVAWSAHRHNPERGQRTPRNGFRICASVPP